MTGSHSTEVIVLISLKGGVVRGLRNARLAYTIVHAQTHDDLFTGEASEITQAYKYPMESFFEERRCCLLERGRKSKTNMTQNQRWGMVGGGLNDHRRDFCWTSGL